MCLLHLPQKEEDRWEIFAWVCGSGPGFAARPPPVQPPFPSGAAVWLGPGTVLSVPPGSPFAGGDDGSCPPRAAVSQELRGMGTWQDCCMAVAV